MDAASAAASADMTRRRAVASRSAVARGVDLAASRDARSRDGRARRGIGRVNFFTVARGRFAGRRAIARGGGGWIRAAIRLSGRGGERRGMGAALSARAERECEGGGLGVSSCVSGERVRRGGGVGDALRGAARVDARLVVGAGATRATESDAAPATHERARTRASGDLYAVDVIGTSERGGVEGGDRVRWRARWRRDSHEARSPDFQSFACVGKRSRIGWSVELRSGDADGISVFLRRERGADDGARERAVDCAFSLSLIANEERHFETYLEHRFEREGDRWGAENLFPGQHDRDLVVEVCFHEMTHARAPRAKTSSVASSVRCVAKDCLLFVLEDFVTEEEGEELIRLAASSMQRSRVTDGKLSDGRTSSSTFLTGARSNAEIVRTLQRRIQRAVRLPIITSRRGPEILDEKEPMQVVSYGPTERYTAHYDNRAGSVKRTCTFMTYLREPEAGGATFFPKAIPLNGNASTGQTGVKISPKRGRAICFWSVSSDGREAMRSLHEAQPVNAGEKVIFTQWLSAERDADEHDRDEHDGH